MKMRREMKAIHIKGSDYLTSEQQKGVALHLSTYDIPTEVRADFDETSGVLHIFFDYIDQERTQTRPQKLADHFCVKLGQNSGKILGFEVQVKKYDVKEVLVTISKAVKAEIPRLKRFNQKANYEIVSSVLSRKRDDLVEAAAAP
jgi:hypothetical protein